MGLEPDASGGILNLPPYLPFIIPYRLTLFYFTLEHLSGSMLFVVLVFISLTPPLTKSWGFFVMGIPPVAYSSSQARGGTGVAAASQCHNHSSTGSELPLRPTPQFVATLDP